MHLSGGRDDVLVYPVSGLVGRHSCIHLLEGIGLDRVELAWEQVYGLAKDTLRECI